MRSFFLNILIYLLERELTDLMPKEPMRKEEEDGLLSMLWQSPAFRKHVADRDAKLIFTMAGGEGLGPEPREQYWLHAGQRVETLILARQAKAAYTRMEKELANKKAAEVKAAAEREKKQ